MTLITSLKKYSLLHWSLFFSIIAFNGPWFFWGYNYIATIIQYSSLLILYSILRRQGRLKGNKGVFITFMLLFYFVIIQIFHQIHFSYILVALSYLVSTRLTGEEGEKAIKMLTTYVFFSVVIPLPLWLIHQFVFPLPQFGSLDISLMKGDDAIMCNYLFFVTNEALDVMRFYSWYDEPGTLGTLAAFVLWANQYNMKDKKVLSILIGCLFTFSMAFYILTLFGWLLQSLKSVKKVFITVIAIVLVGYVSYIILEDNPAFQNSVVNRVMDPEGNGLDNRTGDEKADMWEEAKKSNSLLFGLGSGAAEVTISYKYFILNFGYAGLFLLFVAYFALIKRRVFLCYYTLLFFFISFLQRPQLFEVFNIMLYSCIINCFIAKRESVISNRRISASLVFKPNM